LNKPAAASSTGCHTAILSNCSAGVTLRLIGLGDAGKHVDTLQPVSAICLALIPVLALMWLFAKDHRANASTALVLVLTVYVVYGLYGMVTDKRRAKSGPTIQVDQSEIFLRIGSAINSMGNTVGSATHSKAPPAPEKMFKDFMKDSAKVLDKSFASDPKNAVLAARRVILFHEMHEPINLALEQLKQTEPTEGPALAKDLEFMYPGWIDKTGSKKSNKPDVNSNKTDEKSSKAYATYSKQVEEDLVRRLPEGWYRNTALIWFYRATHEDAKLKALLEKTSERDGMLLTKFFITVAVVVILFLVGAIVDLVQLIFLPRSLTGPDQVALVRAPAPYGFKAVYGVFLCWLATELTTSLIAQNALKNLHLMQHGVLVVALGTTALYLVSNGPGPAYAYFLAMKPHGVSFLEGIKFRLRVGATGPKKLILTGVIAYVGAIPLVVLAYAIAFRLMNSQGSANPIIALVMEAARSANFAAILVFYFTVGVLAPVCEESLFRGFLYSSLRRKLSVLPSMVISALIFAAAHMDPGGFLALFTLGCVFAFVFEKTKSTLPGMVAHGLWNSGTFTLVLMLFGN
jgi:membrane protease YdiL (CAAX protease family)